MSMLIVPEPLFDAHMSVGAYRLRSHDGAKMLGIKDNHRQMDEAFIHPGLDIVEKIGLEPFTGGSPLFVELTPMQVMTGAPLSVKLPEDKLVCVIPASLASSAEAAEHICRLGDHGYKIALNGFPEDIQPAVKPYVEYVLLDHTQPNFYIRHARLTHQMRRMRTVIYNIPSVDAYNSLKRDNRALFSGGFYSKPITSGKSQLSPVKVNALRLLSQVNQEDFDLGEIVSTIERDPYLTVSLLRFINSNASGLKKQVDSIRQGVAILGQKAARQWAMVALSVTLGDDRPSEITRLALLRAKFAEDLAVCFELGVFQSSLFMAGLFSLLDVMLEKPMEEAVKEVALDARVTEALVEKSGPFAPVMELINAYERADWDEVSILMIKHNTDMAHVSKAYLDSLKWYQDLLQSIDEDSQAEEQPEN